MSAGSSFIRWGGTTAKHLNRHEWTLGSGQSHCQDRRWKYSTSLHLGYYGEHFAIKHSEWESKVCGWDITNNVLCIPLPTIFTTEYLQLHNCKTVPQEFGSSACCKELYCNKQRMSKDMWPKLFSNPTEHLTVQHILRAEVLKDRNKLEQSTFVPSRDMTPLQRLFYYQKALLWKFMPRGRWRF